MYVVRLALHVDNLEIQFSQTRNRLVPSIVTAVNQRFNCKLNAIANEKACVRTPIIAGVLGDILLGRK